MRLIKLYNLPFILFLIWVLGACDPMAPQPTPQVIIITPPPSNTPVMTATPTPTRTPLPTATRDATPTATPFPCETDGGTMLAFDEFRSPTAGENLRYRVYIPPCYLETQKRYPYVILLHGQATTELQWDSIGVDEALDQGIRLSVLAPMIMVMPYTGSIANFDQFPPDPSYETVVLDELMPAIERDFCTWSDRTHRAIGGISRGGFWAYSIGLRHPDIFGIIGGHSAVFDESNAPAANNPLDLALNASFLEEANVRMYLDNAASDLAGQGQELFSSRLSSRGIAHTYIIHPLGDHTDDYWSAHVSEYLSFYAKDWPRNTSELPDCAQPSP
jgi:enterochelin esterase-like enzyme